MLVLCNTPFVHAHVYLQYLNSALPGLQPIEADVVHLIIGGVQGGSIQAMEPWCLHMEKVFIPLHDFFFFFFWRRLSLLFTKKKQNKNKMRDSHSSQSKQAIWPYCGHDHLQIQIWALDELGNCIVVMFVVMNHEDSNYKSQTSTKKKKLP